MDLACLESPVVFPEMWDMSGFREYCSGHLARERNIVTLIAYHDAGIQHGLENHPTELGYPGDLVKYLYVFILHHFTYLVLILT